jgi:hypothetical protein
MKTFFYRHDPYGLSAVEPDFYRDRFVATRFA